MEKVAAENPSSGCEAGGADREDVKQAGAGAGEGEGRWSGGVGIEVGQRNSGGSANWKGPVRRDPAAG